MKKSADYILKHILFPALRVGGGVYIFFGVFLFFMQSSILYHPSERDFYDCLELEADYERLITGKTRLYFREQSEDSVLVHYHGNAGRACDRAFKQDILESSGRSIILVEYSGYSGDSLPPNKNNILQNTHDIAEFITERGFKDVVIYGESLGSAVASYHASHSGGEKLILVSPFTSVADVAAQQYPLYPIGLLLRENFTTQDWLQDFSGDIAIFHGSTDAIISPYFSKELYKSLRNTHTKKYKLIEGYGHNNLWNSAIFQETFTHYIR